MYNPLLDNPSKLKDQELDDKILDLSKKYWIASRMGQGMVANQIAGTIEMYRDEQQRRYSATTKTLAKDQDKDLDGLINID
jgi:hypothetical protein